MPEPLQALIERAREAGLLTKSYPPSPSGSLLSQVPSEIMTMIKAVHVFCAPGTTLQG